MLCATSSTSLITSRWDPFKLISFSQVYNHIQSNKVINNKLSKVYTQLQADWNHWESKIQMKPIQTSACSKAKSTQSALKKLCQQLSKEHSIRNVLHTPLLPCISHKSRQSLDIWWEQKQSNLFPVKIIRRPKARLSIGLNRNRTLKIVIAASDCIYLISFNFYSLINNDQWDL